MAWIARHWPGMLVTVFVVGAIAGANAINLPSSSYAEPYASPGFTNHDLARALGDSGDLVAPPWITCRTRSGRVGLAGYNRRCVRRDVEELCSPGTGETRTAILVRVSGHRYQVVDERVVWVDPPCATVA